MRTVLYKANTRGHANHGWLDTHHTFSFANYYDPDRINFGALRVVNDDIVEGGKGFGTHPHDNMEIVSIPLKGGLKHGDSMGNGGIIHEGEVQVMSAGTGVLHSEFNAYHDKPVNFFQIWVFPNKNDVKPRYEQKKMDFPEHRNKLSEIVTPTPTDHSLWIHQNAWFNIGMFDKNVSIDYALKDKGNGVFVMVIEGKFNVSGTELDKRDAIGIWETDSINLKALSDDAQILLIEVPMEF
ncbi:pirin family protein [Dysgonomonas sp. 520]|uniref:pirin family protein n=1 Tax=Dysgonomonas sp. 520 TaxID=2302931 RepID=UPI0013D86529|nr:pirin family protein [Dysgonomonas sp. 520]NDW09760.1 pirin family protein [Dysgonomonas sp. 520]